MPDNFDATQSTKVENFPVETAIPTEILKKIKNAWITGVISGSLTLLVTLLAITGTSIIGATGWTFLDAALIFGLTFGIYKKSRTCAVLMCVYFIVAKILILIGTGKPTGATTAFLFVYFYAQGVIGTFQYHKLANTLKQ